MRTFKKFPFPSLHTITQEKARSATNTLLEHVHTLSNRNLNWTFAKQTWEMSRKRARRWRNERKLCRRERNGRKVEQKSERKVSGNFELSGFSPFPRTKSLQVEGLTRGNFLALAIRRNPAARSSRPCQKSLWSISATPDLESVHRTPLDLPQSFLIHEAHKEKKW